MLNEPLDDLRARWKQTGQFEDGHRFVQAVRQSQGGQPSPIDILGSLYKGHLPVVRTGDALRKFWGPELPPALSLSYLQIHLFQYFWGFLLFLRHDDVDFLFFPQQKQTDSSTLEGVLWPSERDLGPELYDAWLDWARQALWRWGSGPVTTLPPCELVRLDFGPLLHRHLWEQRCEATLEGERLVGTLALLETLFSYTGDTSHALDRPTVVLSAEALPSKYRNHLGPASISEEEGWIVQAGGHRVRAFSYKTEGVDGATGHRDRVRELTLALNPKRWVFSFNTLWEEVEWGVAYS